ncbi:hypothetical protein GCM10028808_03700 [Spirosoma migulaei]
MIQDSEGTKSVIYLNRLSLKNVKCFKSEYDILFTVEKNEPSQWTVILGNNNTGKTTLLRLLAAANNLVVEPKDLKEDLRIRRLKNYRKEQDKAAAFSLVTAVTKFDMSHLSHEFPATLITTSSNNTILERYFAPTPSRDRVKDKAQENWQFIDGYGISRRASDSTLTDYSNFEETTRGLFFDNELLTNAEEWLLQLDYASKSHIEGATERLEQLKYLLLSKIFPDIQDIKFETKDNFKPLALFLTAYGWVKLNQLSYGYQTTIAWVVDLAKRMFDRYPDLDNPLHGPAIVLVDEIDLHLHPEWQRKIIKYLSDLFPNTQFIVTAHSPLIVQSAENVNLIMLEKDDETGSINIRQQFGSFQGWTVEEILRELMDMGEKTRSDSFLKLLGEFEKGLNEENYDKAKTAYDQLDKILHPASSQRKLLSIQLSSLVPA